MNADDHWKRAQEQNADRRREARWMAVFGAAVALAAKAYIDTDEIPPPTNKMNLWVSQAEDLANFVDEVSPIL